LFHDIDKLVLQRPQYIWTEMLYGLRCHMECLGLVQTFTTNQFRLRCHMYQTNMSCAPNQDTPNRYGLRCHIGVSDMDNSVQWHMGWMSGSWQIQKEQNSLLYNSEQKVPMHQTARGFNGMFFLVELWAGHPTQWWNNIAPYWKNSDTWDNKHPLWRSE
jgi:hypothetical protein